MTCRQFPNLTYVREVSEETSSGTRMATKVLNLAKAGETFEINFIAENNGADGNYVTERKDARGKIVRTETDPERGTTTSVTDAKGQKVTYEYDNLRRIVKTSAKTGAEAGIPTIHNEYTYDEQRGNQAGILVHLIAEYFTDYSFQTYNFIKEAQSQSRNQLCAAF